MENNKENYSLKKATLIYGVARYSTVVINLIITGILSRLLLPNEYSVVALVSVFSTFFSAISNMGIGTGVIQYKQLVKSDFDDLFTLSFYISLFMGIVFVLMGYPVSLIYNDAVYRNVFLVLSISVFFTSLNAVPDAILLREKCFYSVGIRMIVTTVLSGAVAVGMAFWGGSYYSLLIQMIISSACNAVWNIAKTKVKLKIKINVEAFKLIYRYSSYQFGYNLINYFAQNFDNLVIPKTIGVEALAYYNKSYTLMRYPINLLPHTISPVLHPILSNFQENKEQLFEKYLQVTKILSILGIYITGVCFFFADDLIETLFGTNWGNAVQPFQILSLCIWAQLINAIAGSIYQSLGNTDKMFTSGIIHVGVTMVFTIVGAISKNLIVLSFCVMVSLNIKFFIETFFLVGKCFKKSLFQFYRFFSSDFVNLVLLIIIDYGVSQISIDNSFIALVIKVFISLVAYIFVLCITKQIRYMQIILKK